MSNPFRLATAATATTVRRSGRCQPGQRLGWFTGPAPSIHRPARRSARPGLGPAGPAARKSITGKQLVAAWAEWVGSVPACGLHGFMASWVARNMTGPTVLDQYNNLSGHSRRRCAHSLKIGPLPVRGLSNIAADKSALWISTNIRSACLLFLACFIFYVTKYFMWPNFWCILFVYL